MRSALLAAVLTVLAPPVAAIAPGTVCFGNEPSWSLRFHDERRATLSFPDTGARELRGRATMLAPLREWMWRGRSANGGDLVAFISEAACSDNMSDLKHPTTVRASLPDHRFLAGCCRIAQAQGASGFEGRTWTLTDLPAAPANLPAGRNAVTARFENGRVSGFAACNTFTGSYAKEGGRLVVGSIAATMMACPEPAMTLERTVLRALTGSFRVDVADRSLTLSSESGSAIRFAEAAQPKLEGVQWKVTGFNNGRQAVLSPRLGTTLSVGFENGAVRGNAGCNTFRGTYTVNGGRIAIRALAATRKLCREEGVMEQEREFLAALESTVRWTIERGMLDMRGADGARTLTAARGRSPRRAMRGETPILRASRSMDRSMHRALLVALSFVIAGFHTVVLAQSAVTTSAVNVHAGPDRFFPTVTWVLSGTPAKVIGCVESWRWCDVEVAGKRGWIYARYLSVPHEGRKVTIAQGGPTLGIAPVGFSLRDYWEAQYKDRRWFAQAAHYQERWERRRPQPAWKAPTSRE